MELSWTSLGYPSCQFKTSEHNFLALLPCNLEKNWENNLSRPNATIYNSSYPNDFARLRRALTVHAGWMTSEGKIERCI